MGLTIFAVLLVCACAFAQVVEFADCELRPIAGSGVAGTVRFTRAASDSMVTVTVSVTGIPTATPTVAIHVHTWGDVSDTTAGQSAGGHYVGAGVATHGCYPSTTRHEGDMGNWTVTAGAISTTKQFDLLTLTGPNSILGRAVIVHAQADDCTTQPTGAAGARLAQCVIGFGNMTTIAASGPNGATVAVGNTALTSAVCDLTTSTTAVSSPHGSVYFTLVGGAVNIVGRFTGINGTHGLHIHTSGDLSLANFVSAGGHWNPTNVSHGLPPNSRHTGDLGNVQTYDTNGIAWYNYTNSALNSIEALLGRAVILHASFDHGAGLGCDQAGTSGVRYMACVIGVGNATAVALNLPSTPTVDNTWVNVDCATPAPTTTVPPATTAPTSTTAAPATTTTTSFAVAALPSLFVLLCVTIAFHLVA